MSRSEFDAHQGLAQAVTGPAGLVAAIHQQAAAAVINTNPRLNRAIQLHLDARADRVRAENTLCVMRMKEQQAHRELIAARLAAGLSSGG